MINVYTPHVRNRDAVVKGTGVSALDQANLEAAKDHLNAQGGGTLWIDGEVFLDGNLSFAAAVSLRGLHTDSAMNVKSGAIQWGTSYDPTLVASGTIDPTGAFAIGFQNPSISIDPGDWVLVWSDDNLTGMQPHLTNNRPMELHQVKEVRSGLYLLDDFIVDALTTNPQIAKVDMLKGVTVSNLRLRYSGVAENTRLFDVRRLAGATFENLLWEHEGPGPIVVSVCADINFYNVSCHGKHNYDTGFGYHMVCGVVNGLRFADSDVRGVRHVFTTSGFDEGSSRYGTPRNVVVDNIRCGNNNKSTGSHIMLDTHSEGWGVVIQNCNVEIPRGGCYAGSARARHTIFRNNRIFGSSTTSDWAIAFAVYADDCEVVGNEVEGCWMGVDSRIINGGTYMPNGTKVISNSFRDMLSHCVGIRGGEGHRVVKNDFQDFGGTAYSGTNEYTRSAVHVDDGTDIRITLNDMPKSSSNLYSVHGGNCDPTDLEVVGNVCTGYGSGVVGFDTGPTTGASLEAAYAGLNWVDA